MSVHGIPDICSSSWFQRSQNCEAIREVAKPKISSYITLLWKKYEGMLSSFPPYIILLNQIWAHILWWTNGFQWNDCHRNSYSHVLVTCRIDLFGIYTQWLHLRGVNRTSVWWNHNLFICDHGRNNIHVIWNMLSQENKWALHLLSLILMHGKECIFNYLKSNIWILSCQLNSCKTLEKFPGL